MQCFDLLFRSCLDPEKLVELAGGCPLLPEHGTHGIAGCRELPI
jgi:hypothetical protein